MEVTGKQLAILLDTKGPEIRTIKLENGDDVDLVAGQEFTFTTDTKVVGNKERVAVTYSGFAKDLNVATVFWLTTVLSRWKYWRPLTLK